jgi:Na+/H+ antiporter NhaA
VPWIEARLRRLTRTETGSAAVLLTATVAALVWVNIDGASYARFWGTTLTIGVGDAHLAQSLNWWVNDGLMSFFFFCVGLEARREFDMGELRERRRVALPLAAGLAGMAVPIAIYLAFNAGRGSANGWGMAMSTDTAFALGMLALVARKVPDRVRIFLLTFSVVDDLVGLLIIATAYSTGLAIGALLIALAIVAVIVVAVRAGIRSGSVFLVLGTAVWAALSQSGIDPIVVGLVIGLLTYASPATRVDLERASDLFRQYREQPTPQLARSARIGLESAISPNERLQNLYHSWTTYAIVPLFALANAGIAINPSFLSRAFTSPITLGVLVAYVVGKPIGVVGGTWLVTTLSGGRLRPPVGWAAVAGDGLIAGVGFTVALLIASLAFQGQQLDEAKVGVLSAALAASAGTWLVFRVTMRLPKPLKLRALLGTADGIVDLVVPVDAARDHVRGPENAPVTLVEYGDYECHYCGQAEPVVRELLRDYGDLRYVWRHLPLPDVHPRAQRAAEASEAAAAQDAFWEMHELLFAHQDALTPVDFARYAQQIGLDLERFRDDMRTRSGARQIADDVDGADLSNVSGTPTFFVNGRRYQGAYNEDGLSTAVRLAGARAVMGRRAVPEEHGAASILREPLTVAVEGED